MPVESIDCILLFNINESKVDCCDFVIISELNDYRLTQCLY